MKIQIRRQGIVIRTVEVQGDQAKIGSGPESEVRIDDPYLAGHVADLVNRNGEWRLVDAATSLEGISRGGSRIEDEAVALGEPYSVGAFEIVVEGAGGGQPSPAAPSPQAGATPPPPSRSAAPMPVPETVVESFDNLRRGASDSTTPKTLFEAEVPRAERAAPPPPQRTVADSSRPAGGGFQPVQSSPPSGFQPVNVPPPRSASAPPQSPISAPPRKSGSKLRVILLALIAVFVLGAIVVVLMSRGGGGSVTDTATATAAPTPTPPPATPPTSPVEQGDLYARNLEVDKALETWEGVLASGGDDALRQKYASLALDAGMVYAAANNSSQARTYFEKVVKYGPPESPEVQKAKARLGTAR